MLQAFQSFLFCQQKESLHLGGFTMKPHWAQAKNHEGKIRLGVVCVCG